MREVTASVIDANARHAFTRGGCGALAVAIHDLTGWPIIAAGHCDGLVMHYLVRNPAGQLVDINGAHSDDDVCDEYEFHADNGVVTLAEASAEDAWAWWRDEELEPIPADVVRSFAVAVLAAFGTQTPVT